jgi:monoamine oxidase
MLDTIIVGGGLCGLAVGAKLAASGREFVLLEARDRLGGRILTRRCETARMPVDLGATWYWPDIHPRVSGLLGQLGLESFAQSDSGRVLSMTDPNARPEALQVDGVHGGAQRVRGGTSMIINAPPPMVGKRKAGSLETKTNFSLPEPDRLMTSLVPSMD